MFLNPAWYQLHFVLDEEENLEFLLRLVRNAFQQDYTRNQLNDEHGVIAYFPNSC